MLHNILWMALTGLVAFGITCVVRVFRPHPTSFGDWWNAEGVPIWIMCLVLVFAASELRGCV